MKEHLQPYMQVLEPRMMAGKGAPRSTTFGVLGMTKESGMTRSLGGLVQHTVHGKVPAHMSEKEASKKVGQTERHILGHASRTRIPGEHYGAIPYPGMYQSHLGGMLS